MSKPSDPLKPEDTLKFTPEEQAEIDNLCVAVNNSLMDRKGPTVQIKLPEMRLAWQEEIKRRYSKDWTVQHGHRPESGANQEAHTWFLFEPKAK